jgi:hypothetical protein
MPKNDENYNIKGNKCQKHTSKNQDKTLIHEQKIALPLQYVNFRD